MLKVNPPRFNQQELRNPSFDRVKSKNIECLITPKGIKVTGTDCKGHTTDLTQENGLTLEKHGIGSSYRRVSLSDLDSQMWLKKLGEGLATYLRNNEKMEIEKGNITATEKRTKASSSLPLSQVVSSQSPVPKRRRTHSNFVLDKLSQNEQKIYTLYRCGEIVWVDLERLEIKKLELKGESVDHKATIRYWPGIVMERKKAPILDSCEEPTSSISITAASPSTASLSAGTSTSGDSPIRYKVIYCVQLVGLHDEVMIDRLKMAPWVAYEPNVDIAKSSSPSEHANKIRKIRNLKEKMRLKKMSQFPHYKAIMIGSELISLEDIVRLTPVEKNEQSIDLDPKFLFVTSIYEDPNRGIQLTGDGLCRGGLNSTTRKRKLSDYEWNPINTKNEEFTIDLEDVAGRFYVSYPNISVSMEADKPMTLQNRYNTIGIVIDNENLTLDVSPTI
ncbi:14074_t:CDS:2 [Acaulospora colombiana]|uniref:14074_t:CDS:1 n=1 Tax=Acaulospora colombiana TaxID=27376 RepID=A0ACA9K878_9GLOM|nr:14074_t:CDS:2 [Acaulospora colombiana]